MNFLSHIAHGIFSRGNNSRLVHGTAQAPVSHSIFDGLRKIIPHHGTEQGTTISPTTHNNIAHRSQFDGLK